MLMHQEVLGMWSAPCFVPEASPKSTRASAGPFHPIKIPLFTKDFIILQLGPKPLFIAVNSLGTYPCINKHSSCVWTYPWDVISNRTCLQFIPSLLKNTNRLLIPV